MNHDDAETGAHLVDLILGAQEWIHRRVERVELLASGDCIRNQSVDFTLPGEFCIPSTAGRVFVPVSLMKKGPLSRFSATGPHGKPVPVLETASNGRLAVAMLRTMASHAYGYDLVDEPVGIQPLLLNIVHGAPAEGRHLISDLEAILQPLTKPHIPSDQRTGFLAIARQFCSYFLLVVELDSDVVDTRSIIKFSYLESRSDPVDNPRIPLEWALDDFGLTASFHFEFEPPPLLSIARINLTEQIGDGQPTTVLDEQFESAGNIVHLARQPEDAVSTATVVVDVVPKHYGIAVISNYATWIVLGFIAAINVGRGVRTAWLGPVPLASPSAGAVLLAGGGILLTWITRTPEDWMVAKVLRAPRRHLVASAGLLLAAACLMILPIPEPARTWAWVVLLLPAVAVVVVSSRYRRRSRIKISGVPVVDQDDA